MANYNFAVDTCDPEGFASCFTEDGEYSWAENEFHGCDELVAFAKTLGGSGQMRHVVTSMLTDADRVPFVTVQGVYEDDLTHTDGGWLFTKRRFVGDR